MKGKLEFLVNIAFFGGIVLLAYLFFRFLLSPLLPFLVGFLIAAVLEPLIKRIGKVKPRAFASCAVILPFWLLLFWMLFHLGKIVYRETGEMLELIQTTDWTEWLRSHDLSFLPSSVTDQLLQRANDLLPTFLELSQAALGKIVSFCLQLPNAFFFCFATVVSSLLISVSYPKAEPFLLNRIPTRFHAEYQELKDFFTRKILKFLCAYGELFLMNYAIILVGFLMLKIDYPLLLAAVVALFDLLPFIGTATVLVPWGIIEIVFRSNASVGIGLIVIAVIGTVLREVLQPKIIGKTIGLSALATLFCSYLGMKLMGLAGVFLFPLIALFVKEWNSSGRFSLWKNSSE